VTDTEHRSFAALRHAGYRWYFIGNATAMLADNTEHVISYWVIFQKFHSAALAGFAVVSHWVPFLLFSVYAGALADRFDPRRIIQLGMLLFIGVSLAWGLLFYTNALELWQVMLLLVIHGIAGVLWNPPAQLLLHDIVGPEDLQSAVRSNATGRYLGILIGPALGSALLLLVGPALGMFINALVYLPLTLWLWKAPYGPKFRSGQPTVRAAVRGFGEIFATARAIAGNRTVILMTLLSGSAAFFIGNSYQAQMPGFAVSLGHGDPGMSYGALLAADAAGALTAGLILEGRGLMPARVMTALVLAMLWCVALISFALTNVYPLALVLLFAAGFLELSFNAMSQTLVQLNAPAEIRGRVIGMFNVASLGMRAFSGVTVGLVGNAIGIHWSLALSAGALWITVSSLFFLKARRSTVSTV
jgi:MFS family permease